MKLKKILSSVVALAMAVTTLTAFSTTANAKVVSGNVLTDDLLVTSWTEGNEVTLAKATITAGDISTTGADSLIVAGEWIDDSADYAGFLAKQTTASKTVNLYKENQSKEFEVEFPLIGNYDVQFLGENIKITSVKFVDSDVNVALTRGSQEKEFVAGGQTLMTLKDDTNLTWNAPDNTITADDLSSLSFDGTESLVFTMLSQYATGEGNIMVITPDWGTTFAESGFWAGNEITIPITTNMQGKDIAFVGASHTSVKVVSAGKKAVRYIVKIAEEDVADIETVSLKFRNDFDYSEAFETSKCYRSIKANGQTISEDGYVFITFVVNNVPGNFSFDEAIVSFDGERAATFIGANA